MTHKTTVTTSAQSRSARRNFLVGASATAVAGGALIAAGSSKVGRAPVKTSKSVPQGLGYHESAHVRNYYRTAQV
jgi:hypothetical protein